MDQSTIDQDESNNSILKVTESPNQSLWEYEAPNFYDFTKLKTADHGNDDQENERYFLIDHEKVDVCEESKENIGCPLMLLADQSASSIYQTPDKLGTSLEISDVAESFYSAKKLLAYQLRETPLRAKYQNGQTPLKESRPSSIFGKRKSGVQRKPTQSSIEPSYCENDQDNFSSTKSKLFDLSNFSHVLDEVEYSLAVQVDSTLIVGQENIDMNTTLIQSEDRILLEQFVVTTDQETVSSEKDAITEIIKAVNNETMSIADETHESSIQNNVVENENFHEISEQDLKPNESEMTINKSQRQSYVVKSPIVVANSKRSICVHFDQSADSDAAREEIEKKETPAKNVEPKSQASLKIRNRRGTPMIAADKNQRTSMNPERLKRLQKYIKRFSRTPSTEEEKPENNIDEILEENQGKTIKKKETNKSEEIKSEKPCRKSLNRLAILRRPPNTVQQSKRFVSLAEISQNFLRSARKYEPSNTAKTFGKLTKPRSPKLLTALRSKCCRMVKSVEPQSVQKDNLGTIAGEDTKVLKPKATASTNRNLKTNKTTVAHTPMFCTDIRSKLYQQKHSNDDQKQQQQQQVFHAKPMPNFKKIQTLGEQKLRELANNRHRLITTKPFSFESRKKTMSQK